MTGTRNGNPPAQDELNLLVSLFQAGQHAELESRARLLLERYPENGFVWKLLSAALHLQGKDSFPALQKAVEYLPHDAELHSNLGNELLDRGRAAQAIESYRRALSIRPDLAEAHYNLITNGSISGRVRASGKPSRPMSVSFLVQGNSTGSIMACKRLRSHCRQAMNKTRQRSWSSS